VAGAPRRTPGGTAEIIEIDDPSATAGVVALGNKGFMLRRMRSLGFPVPDGFVLTTAFVRERLMPCTSITASNLGHPMPMLVRNGGGREGGCPVAWGIAEDVGLKLGRGGGEGSTSRTYGSGRPTRRQRSLQAYNSHQRQALRMKVRDLLKLIESDDWYQVAQKGSHRQFKHPSKPGRVTVAGHPSQEMDKGTLNNILKQADLK